MFKNNKDAGKLTIFNRVGLENVYKIILVFPNKLI